MLKQRVLTAAIVCCVSSLAACGGGGSDATGTTTGTGAVSGYLSKYAGAYSYCDNHQKSYLSIVEIDSSNVALELISDFYMDTNCSGNIVGTLTNSSPTSAKFLSTGSATVKGYPTSASTTAYEVDRVSISVPSLTRTVTGSGVRTINGQRCITYTNGSRCFETSTPAQTLLGGLTLTGNMLLLLNATSTGYTTDSIYSK